MLKRPYITQRKAQSLTEYSLILGVVALIFFAMTPLIRRGTQGMIKTVADQVGFQNEADQIGFSEVGADETNIQRIGTSVLLSSNSTTESIANKQTEEFLGVTTYTVNGVNTTESSALMDLGFQERN